MKRLTSFIALLLVAFGLFAAAGCSKGELDSDYDRIKASGKLVIGISENEPMCYYDAENNLSGFDVEYARGVCDELKLEAEFKVIDWDRKEDELNAGNVDCVWSGLTVTEKRKAEMSFTDAYLTSGLCAVLKPVNNEKYTTFESLRGKAVTALAGSTGEEAILEDVNLATARLLSVDTNKSALDNVLKGKAHAAIVDKSFADYNLTKKEYSGLVVSEKLKFEVEELAVGCRPGSDLVYEINEATEELKENGTLMTIAEKHGLSEYIK